MQANRVRFELIYADEICDLGYQYGSFRRDLDTFAQISEQAKRAFFVDKQIYFYSQPAR